MKDKIEGLTDRIEHLEGKLKMLDSVNDETLVIMKAMSEAMILLNKRISINKEIN